MSTAQYKVGDMVVFSNKYYPTPQITKIEEVREGDPYPYVVRILNDGKIERYVVFGSEIRRLTKLELALR